MIEKLPPDHGPVLNKINEIIDQVNRLILTDYRTMGGPHPSHVTRISMDASTYDEICIKCGATDEVPGGWGRLAFPCPKAPPKPQAKPPETPNASP